MASVADLAPGAVLLGLFAVLVVVRSVRMARGAPVSEARLIGYGVFYVFLVGSVLLFSGTVLPVYSYALDGVALALAFAAATPYVARRVELTQRPDGRWVYRLGWALPVVFLALFLARFAVDLLVLGPTALAGPPGAAVASVSPLTVDTLVLVDALFSASAGLLLGRNVAVYLAYRRRREAPLPSERAL